MRKATIRLWSGRRSHPLAVTAAPAGSHANSEQVIGADSSDIADATQKGDEEGNALLGVDDGALAVAAGAGVKAVAGKQSGGGILRQGKWSCQT